MLHNQINADQSTAQRMLMQHRKYSLSPQIGLWGIVAARIKQGISEKQNFFY